MSLRAKKRKETNLENLTFTGEITNFFTYCIFLITYYFKEKIKGDFWLKFLTLSVVVLFAFRWYYRNDTEMIDGIEVPKRNNNYTLEID
jgi:hypothetical protein